MTTGVDMSDSSNISSLIPEIQSTSNWSREDTSIYHIEIAAVPLLVTLGIFGNLFSIWVLSASSLRGLSSSFYLSSLAASDSGFLVALFIVWLGEGTGLDIYNTPGWCQAITYTSYVTTFLSVWLVVAFTVERFIAVCYPLLRPSVCTVKRARTVVVCLVVVALSLYFYILVAAGTVTAGAVEVCALKEAYIYPASVMNHVDTLLTLLLPVGTLITLNFRIVRCIWYVEKLRPQLSQEVACPKDSPNQLKVTRTLLIISTVFILLNLPSYSMRAYSYFSNVCLTV